MKTQRTKHDPNRPTKTQSATRQSDTSDQADRSDPSDRQPATSPLSPRPSPLSPLPARARYALRRDLGFWQLTFKGKTAILKHEQGIFYVAYLLHNPPEEPIHGVALALEVRALYRAGADDAQIVQQRALGLDDAEAFRALRCKQQELEAILDDRHQIEPVRGEALRELEEIYEFQKHHPWRSRDCAQRTVKAVSLAIRRFRRRLACAVDHEGKPHPVLRIFGEHLNQHLSVPAIRGGPRPVRFADILAGCFNYHPPAGVVWEK